MRLFLSTRSRARDKAPKFLVARLTLAGASLAFGALAVGGWFLAYYETSIWLAIFLSTLSLVSALVVPATATAFDASKGFAKWRLGLVILVFMCIDWAGVHQGYLTIERMATARDYDAAILAWQAERTAMQARLEGVQSRIDALPDSREICEGHGPMNCQARLAGLQADRSALTKQVETARADLNAQGPKPTRPELFPHILVAIVTAALQIVLFVGFGALAETTRRERERLRKERKATEARRKRQRQKKTDRPILKAI